MLTDVKTEALQVDDSCSCKINPEQKIQASDSDLRSFLSVMITEVPGSLGHSLILCVASPLSGEPVRSGDARFPMASRNPRSPEMASPNAVASGKENVEVKH